MNDSKIKIIRKMPAGNDMLVVWIGILCLGMKSGKTGVLEVGDGIPFNDELLSAELDVELQTIRLALETFERLRMIEHFENGEIYITNFEEHQKIDKIEMARKNARLRVAKCRDKKKQIACNTYVTVTPPLCNTNVTPIEQELELELDKDKDKELSFDLFWTTYAKKVGPDKCRKKWDKLSKADKKLAMDYIPSYVAATPNKKFRKNPETFLNNKSWKDELPTESNDMSKAGNSGSLMDSYTL